jgi:phosphoribosylanthranilate isomerase
MALSTLIKISGISNLSDARYNAGMGASILGFCPEPGHPDFVDINKFRAITGWIEGITLAGEFHMSPATEILNLTEIYKFDIIQVEKAQLVEPISSLLKTVIFRFNLSEIQNARDIFEIMRMLNTRVKYFLMDGESRDDEIIKEICEWSNEYPVIMGAGINSSNILSFINQYHFSGFAFKGGNEIKPGYLDPGMMAEIFELLDKNN